MLHVILKPTTWQNGDGPTIVAYYAVQGQHRGILRT